MITGIGTDVVDIDRFRDLEDREAFLAHVFTRTEICNAPGGPAQEAFFATLFTIKEALLKALGCGLESVSVWRDIQITPDWQPRLSGLPGRLAREKSVSKIHVSHSHSGKSAVAFVVMETANREVVE